MQLNQFIGAKVVFTDYATNKRGECTLLEVLPTVAKVLIEGSEKPEWVLRETFEVHAVVPTTSTIQMNNIIVESLANILALNAPIVIEQDDSETSLSTTITFPFNGQMLSAEGLTLFEAFCNASLAIKEKGAELLGKD